MTIVHDSIAESTAQLQRIVRVPVVQGFGCDLVCVDDIDPRARECDPNSNESLAQDLYHRATTDRGACPDDPDLGENVLAWLSEPLTSADLSARAGALATEWRKDDRVDFAIVELTIGANAKELNIRGDITRSDPDLQPFKLLIAVVDGKALLQAILEG